MEQCRWWEENYFRDADGKEWYWSPDYATWWYWSPDYATWIDENGWDGRYEEDDGHIYWNDHHSDPTDVKEFPMV
jgi:hypothetical protein